jgi:hypothetical protein
MKLILIEKASLTEVEVDIPLNGVDVLRHIDVRL